MENINTAQENPVEKELRELLLAFMQKHGFTQLWGWDDGSIILSKSNGFTDASIEQIDLREVK